MELVSCGDKEYAASVKLDKICRICLCTNDCMVSLLSTKENTLLLDIFSSVTSIKVHSQDGLPLQVCEVCENELTHCYQFRIKCKKSHTVLKSIIKKGLAKKDEIGSTGLLCSSTAPVKVPKDAHIALDIKDKGQKINNEVQLVNREESNIKLEIDVKGEAIEVTEVEYLEEGLLEAAEAEAQKLNASAQLEGLNNRLRKNVQTPAKDPKLTIKKEDTDKNRTKGKRKYHICTFCSKKFLKSKTLKTHIKRMHGKARHPHSCGQCKESFSSEHDLHIHSALHTEGSQWTCNQCNKEFKERSKLRRHVRRHMESKRYACEACGKQFAELCALRRHARVHTGEALERKHACHICDKRYSESAALAAHVARHAGLRPCTCEACGKAFPSPRLLASHRRVHSDRKPHACRYCDKRFRHESTRNTHHRTHTGEKPYVCSVCGKSFIQNSNLTLHMRTHTGEKPYACDLCERKFSSGSALANHRRTHTGEKPYSCPVCGKRFARMYLTSHMRQHTGERPFACCICHKRFINAARLRQHHLIHTGEKPFECAICSEKFKTKGYLAKHLKNHEMIKNLQKKGKVLILQEVDQYEPILVSQSGEIVNLNDNASTPMISCEDDSTKNITVEVTDEMPLEVSEELILPEDGNEKTELLVVNNDRDMGNICLNTNGVNFMSNELNYGNDVKLVTLNEGEVNISAASMLEGTTVKLYQLDQSLLQIHTSGGQVTISKITSKMTANF